MENDTDAVRAVEGMMAAIQCLHEKIDGVEMAVLELVEIFRRAEREPE
jgi:hypothetical protein